MGKNPILLPNLTSFHTFFQHIKRRMMISLQNIIIINNKQGLRNCSKETGQFIKSVN